VVLSAAEILWKLHVPTGECQGLADGIKPGLEEWGVGGGAEPGIKH
jgi:hypothetical protein